MMLCRTYVFIAALAGSLLLTSPLLTSPSPANAQEARPATRPATAAATTATRAADPARWEKEIAAFEAADRANPPVKGGIVFTGSSTIRRWETLAKDFPDYHVINRGFGGSQIADATYHADRFLVPLAPRLIVLRSGMNDIHSGKSAEQVFADYRDFVATIRSKLPDVEILFVSVAPAPVRWDQRHEDKKLNELVEEYSKSKPGLRYVETYDTTVNPDGSPREELFVKDRLHFNNEGYRLLVDRLRPALADAMR